MSHAEAADMIRQMRDEVRADNGDMIASMPHDAKTPGQEALKKKHGSPRVFAQACVNAIGEISCLEAHTAIARYKEQWDKA
jgi:hypothetical protein